MKFANKMPEETKESIKVYATIVGVGTCSLVSGYLCGYKIGHKTGCKITMNHLLNKIVDRSCYNGLKIANSLGEHYVFTAKKLVD